jgi:UDP-N-acetylglucosamine--N-acetylmuramyl-(pentapeptide) pyrophosphoryl-undecaprenol N-acetylglucosamine transferase
MKILFACSGSGGHLFPALSVARTLKASGGQDDIVFISERNKVSVQILSGCEFKVFFLNEPNPGGLALQPKGSIIKLVLTLSKSLRLVKEIDPDVVVGFGGYASVIPVLVARLSGKRTIIHEQNVWFGKANKFLSFFADTIAVSFKQTLTHKRLGNTKRMVYTGLPLRSCLERHDRVQASHFFNIDPALFTILVLGGSAGSHAINRFFLEAIDNLPQKQGLQVIHICGFSDEDEVKSFYAKRPSLKARVFTFLNEMAFAYSCADLCLCRSGAATIYELGFFKLPAVLIPYPYAASHQRANARLLEEINAALVIEERYLQALFRQTLARLIKDRILLDKMHRNFPEDFMFDASRRLAEIIKKVTL